MAASPAFAALRDAFDLRFRAASSATFVQADGTAVPTGLDAVDRALAGGFPKGAISTLEGPASSGRTALAASLLAAATAGGAAALVDWRDDPSGHLFAPALAAAGVDLERLLIVRVAGALDVMRAADIVLRSSAFGALVIPAVPHARAAIWTRLGSLAHHANAVVLAVGTEISSELRYFASVRVECSLRETRWVGAPGPFRALAGYELCAQIRKHKRAAPNGEARLAASAEGSFSHVSYACRSKSSGKARSHGG